VNLVSVFWWHIEGSVEKTGLYELLEGLVQRRMAWRFLGLRRNLAVVLLCTILASLQWRGVEATMLRADSLEWRKPRDLTEKFLGQNDKPIMLLIHKSWCGACSRLRAELNDGVSSHELHELSKRFVMVEAVDSEEPLDDVYSPDGQYYPRVLFLEPQGQVRAEYTCDWDMNPAYKYFYKSAQQVTKSMKTVLESLRGAAASGIESIVTAPTVVQSA
jgi:protein-disulfide reductase (glutathione)